MRTSFTVAAAALVALVGSSSCAQSSDGLLQVRVENGAAPFAGDGPTVATVSPNGDGYRDAVLIHYRLAGRAVVGFGIARHGSEGRSLATASSTAAGDHVYRWVPPSRPVPASYIVRVSAGESTVSVVVHVQGVDAAAGRAAYHPGDTARLAVGTDARGLWVDVLRITGAAPTTRRNDKVQGTPMAPAFHVRWPGHGDRPHALALPLGATWRSGVYFARLRADDGRIGYAPIVLRPHRLGRNRVAVVLPTNTWQAYDFFDRDGDGRGDTWYAGWRRSTTHLGRPYLDRGVPAHFATYDLPFLRWAARNDLRADYLSDADLASIGSGDALARLYDLVLFPGHHEYVTEAELDVVTRYRDVGGNLAWLSANNFFWKVVRHGPTLQRVAQWRRLGRPEAALIGAQYHGNDEGQRRAPMIVSQDPATAWLFDQTGLRAGDGFGNFGIEIDARAPASPPGTHVAASVTDLYGTGKTAEMTYYETAAGAKVFAAGAFTLAGLADSRVGAQILANLVAHLEQP
jgi:N,N-dimethylformamidase beta subunit-like protein